MFTEHPAIRSLPWILPTGERSYTDKQKTSILWKKIMPIIYKIQRNYHIVYYICKIQLNSTFDLYYSGIFLYNFIEVCDFRQFFARSTRKGDIAQLFPWISHHSNARLWRMKNNSLLFLSVFLPFVYYFESRWRNDLQVQKIRNFDFWLKKICIPFFKVDLCLIVELYTRF